MNCVESHYALLWLMMQKVLIQNKIEADPDKRSTEQRRSGVRLSCPSIYQDGGNIYLFPFYGQWKKFLGTPAIR